MYELTKITQYNSEPWNKSLFERIRSFQTDVRSGYKITVQMSDQADASTFRYLCYNTWQYTRQSDKWKSHYFFKNECEIVKKYLNSIDLLVFCRTLWSYPYQELIDSARASRIQIIFQVDDLICLPDYLMQLTNQIGEYDNSEEFYMRWFGWIGRWAQIAKQADGFVVTNDFLGKILEREYNKPYKVIHNALNDEQIKVSDVYYAEKKNQKKKTPYTIGYFSGSPTHINDYNVVDAELVELLRKYDDVNILLVGFMKFSNKMHPYIDDRVEIVPIVDFIDLQYYIGRVDICIAPLMDSVFTNCKSELKFFEAAIVGTPVVATPTYSFKNIITNGENGFLCKEGEWFDTLEGLYLGKYDTESIAKKAYETAKFKYCGRAIVDEIEEAYEFFS